MKVNANTLRAGNVVDIDGRLLVVTKNELIQPGKGNAVAQVEVRDLRTGNKDNFRFRTQETVERVRLEQDAYQYLFADGDDLTFMHLETFEQIIINRTLIGPPAAFLQDGMAVEVETFEGEPLGVKLPKHVTMEIVEADPVIKGQTATTSYKPAVLENGEKILVPPHIVVGTRVVVNIEDGTYVERAKD
jgi:elongation factor P